jgi:hypothetical protein
MGTAVCRTIQHLERRQASSIDSSVLVTSHSLVQGKAGHFMENDAANRFVKKCDAARIPRINV